MNESSIEDRNFLYDKVIMGNDRYYWKPSTDVSLWRNSSQSISLESTLFSAYVGNIDSIEDKKTAKTDYILNDTFDKVHKNPNTIIQFYNWSYSKRILHITV